MVVSKRGKITCELQIGDVEIKQLQKYKYLGRRTDYASGKSIGALG